MCMRGNTSTAREQQSCLAAHYAAITDWQGSVYHVQVAQNMDASLIAVAYLVAELLKEEVPESKGVAGVAGPGGGGGGA